MKMNLSTKIISLFVLGGVIPMVAIGIISYNSSRKALEQQAFNQLVSVRNTKQVNINDWFNERKANMVTLSASPLVVNALKELKGAFREAGAEKVRDLYIANNPFPAGKKLEYYDAKDGSKYSNIHARVHPFFKQYLEEYAYYDIFLVDGETGDILYTVFKELDYGTNLVAGTYNTTNIARLFKEVNSANTGKEVKLVDFESYAPSNGDPAAFIASPVFDGEQKIGVLIFQLPIYKIDLVMQERSGLGETGETYLVGSDKMMRSNSRFSEKPTVFITKVDTDGVKEALAGKTDCKIINDYRGVPVLSAYMPFNVQGHNWAVLAEIDKAEAFKSIDTLGKSMIIIGICAAGFVAGLGILVVKITSKISGLFRSLLEELTCGATQVASASEQISASSQSLSESTTQQAASIEETSSTMEEISSMTKQNADNAVEAANLAKGCNNTAVGGNTTVTEMDDAMKKIYESSGKIADIIKIIEGIAFQTNLLALNAAVEAARAGEHGRGFAVVAEEVRNLAQRSSAASKDITTLITDSVKKAENGTELVKKTKEVFSGVVSQVKKVTDLVNEIATASAEQTNGIEQISKAIQQMDQVVQQNAATAEETAAASEELTSQAQSLNSLVDKIGKEVGAKDVENNAVVKTTKVKSENNAFTPLNKKPSPVYKKNSGSTITNTKQSKTDRTAFYKHGEAEHKGNGKKYAVANAKADRLIPMTDDETFKDF